jgi:RND family efflux transporter MFP subunit
MADERPVRKGRNVWGLVAVAVVVAAVAGYFIYRSASTTSQKTQYVTSAVAKGTLTVAVSANGSARTARSASVDPAVSGTVLRLQVKLGDQVKAGELLFSIDNSDLDGQVSKALASYEKAKTSVQNARKQVEQADYDHETLVAQREAQEASIAAQTGASARGISGQAAPSGGSTGSGSGSTSGSSSSLVATDQIEIAAMNVKSAKMSLDNAQSDRDNAYFDYGQAVENAAKRQVTAPIDGYITTLNVQDGDQLGTGSTSRTGTTGSTSSGSTTPIVISDLSSIQAQVQVSETDRPKVKAGQKATMTFDAIPDLAISGQVASIDAVGTTSQNVVTYNVVVTFDVQDQRISPGMTVAAGIVTDVRQGVLLVPNGAVKTVNDGSRYVQVQSDPNGTPRQVTVTAGAASDTQTEITEGVKEGDMVVTQTIQAGATSTTTGGGARTGMGILGGGGAHRD